MVTRIKLCGFTRAEDIAAAVHEGVHAIGLVFYAFSPRYVTPELAQTLMAAIPPFVTTVGLFVNATPEEVQSTLKYAPVQLLQFHGDETVQQCHAIAEAVQRPFIRALRVSADMKAEDLLQYEADYRNSSSWFRGLLLDTFADSYGGSGKVFDWSIIPKELAPRVVLSGGLTVHNVGGAVEQLRPYAVDTSSGIELSKGIKDHAKMRALIQAVQLADANLPENLHESQSH